VYKDQVISLRLTQGLAPVNLTLTGTTVAENLPADSPVGTLAALDYTPSDTFTYSLVSGPGSTDNSNFKISGSQLLTGKVLDFETKPLQSVRIRVTDSGRNTFERVFQITVTGVVTDDDDKDGLTEAEENLLGTGAAVIDSDRDGAHDGTEVAAGTNPLSATSKPATYVAAWGLNTNGQCGVPVGLGPVITVAAGSYHSLALKEDGTVAAWGSNSSGQCDVPFGLTDVVAIAAKGNHNIALRADGTVVAWGDSSYSLNTVPSGLADVVAVSAGDYLNAALRSNGEVVAWGTTSYDLDKVPAAAQGSVWLTANDYTAGTLNRDGSFVGWGSDWQNLLDGPQTASNLTALAGGEDLFVGLDTDGRVRAWGWDIYDATTVPAGLGQVVRVGAGANLGLAIQQDGRLAAWGRNTNKQLEIPAGLGSVQMADAGYGHVVALVREGIPDHFPTRSIRAVVGIPLTRQLSYAGMADRFEAMFVPPGLAFDTTACVFTGTPTVSGTFNVRVTAVKGYSRVSQVIPVFCEPPRSFNEWKSARFAASGVPVALTDGLADADADDLCNLLEYALHRNPLVPEASPPVERKTVRHQGVDYLALSYERIKGATDLRDVVEVSGNLGPWQSGPAATVMVGIVDHGDTETVTVRDTTPVTSAVRRFIRLKVERTGAD
jgi:alpha-tubulin suppressor-like RCC1 family protein